MTTQLSAPKYSQESRSKTRRGENAGNFFGFTGEVEAMAKVVSFFSLGISVVVLLGLPVTLCPP
jgi:hypothetical protein